MTGPEEEDVWTPEQLAHLDAMLDEAEGQS